MHPNSSFRWDDRSALRAFASEVGFGSIFATTPDGPRVGHAPFVFTTEDTIAFHLARGNGLTKHLDGMDGLFLINGPDAYISPDWYDVADQVPTWNYLALELQGPIRQLNRDELAAQVDAVSAAQEQRHAPKPEWTKDKMAPGLFDKMLGGIVGFEMTITAWRGTAKLGQNKTLEVRENAAKGLDDRGALAMAHLMRTLVK